jgi:hypothetical protein
MGLSISIVRRWGVICAKGRVVISQVLRRGGRDLGHPAPETDEKLKSQKISPCFSAEQMEWQILQTA